jgi:hypothetical protein
MLVVVEVQLIFFRLTQQQRVLAAQVAVGRVEEMLTELLVLQILEVAVVVVVERLQSQAAQAAPVS